MNAAERQLVEYLADLRDRAGAPSTRSIARSMGNVSHTTISEILNGSRLSSWHSIRRLGEFLGANSDILISLWRATQSNSEMQNDPAFDPFILDEVVVHAVMQNRFIVERTTERRVTATTNNNDHYVARAFTVSAELGVEVDIVAVMNCAIGESRLLTVPGNRTVRIADVALPEPLNVGDSCVFTTRSLHSIPDSDRVKAQSSDKVYWLSFEVTAQRADRVRIRVQFELDDIPRKCWAFPGGPESDMWIEPTDGSDRILKPSRFGFVEYNLQDLWRASTVAIVWAWNLIP